MTVIVSGFEQKLDVVVGQKSKPAHFPISNRKSPFADVIGKPLFAIGKGKPEWIWK